MPTARTESTTSKKAAGSSAAAPQANGPAAESFLAPGAILAERYRDTAYEAVVGKNGENVSAAMSAGEAMLAGMAEVSQEMLSFAGNRLRDDMETAEDLSKASSPQELFEKQCGFARRAAQQYAEETSKMIGLMARIQQSCWAPMEACAKTALQNLSDAEDETGKAAKK
jgi:hypothetical protein